MAWPIFVVSLVWIGRRQIPGIEPGTTIQKGDAANAAI